MSGPMLFVADHPEVMDLKGLYMVELASGTEKMRFVLTAPAANMLAHRINDAVRKRALREVDAIVEFKAPARRKKKAL